MAKKVTSCIVTGSSWKQDQTGNHFGTCSAPLWREPDRAILIAIFTRSQAPGSNFLHPQVFIERDSAPSLKFREGGRFLYGLIWGIMQGILLDARFSMRKHRKTTQNQPTDLRPAWGSWARTIILVRLYGSYVRTL